MVKVSVIMAVYNGVANMAKSIESIQKQTYTDWEFIICDDCSTDNTFEMLQQVASEDTRIKIIQNGKNRKLAYSLNHCLSVASGEYIARMDHDDIALPDRFEQQVKFLDEHSKYDVVGGGVILYDDFGNERAVLNNEYPTVRMMKSKIPFFHPTIMMRKSAYDKLGGYTVCPRTTRGQDMDLWFRFFAQELKGYNLQFPILKYHDDINDYTKKNSLKCACRLSNTMIIGFKINKFPLTSYIYALKPVFAAILPQKFVYWIHKKVNN